MIEQITIQNFQSHKSSTLNLDPGVNSIIGQSDSGKSTILRALYWCLYGKPNGDSIKSNWGGITAVLVDFNEGVRVSKQRDKTNVYCLGIGLDYSEFKAIGSGVPEEIQKSINMGDLNFQAQLDAPFFLSLTPGEAARQLNEIVHLEIIDRSISNGNRMIRELKSKESFIKEEIESREKGLESTKYIQKTYKMIKEAEEIESSIGNLREDAFELKVLIDDITSINFELSEYNYIKEVDFSITDRLLKETNKVKDNLFNLSNIICDIENNEKALESINGKIDSLEKQFKKEFPDVCPLCGK